MGTQKSTGKELERSVGSLPEHLFGWVSTQRDSLYGNFLEMRHHIPVGSMQMC